MERSINGLKSLILRSFQDPRGAISEVTSLQLPRPTLWLLLALSCAVSVIVSYVTGLLLPTPELADNTQIFRPSPFFLAGLMLVSQAILIFLASFFAGNIAGGQGSFDDVLALVILQQIILLALNLIQFGIALVLPAGAGLFGLGAMIIVTWQLCHFVAEIHGFKSALQVFFGGVAAIFVISIVLSIVLISLGLVPLEGI
ncbi:YIP1 family protein [Halocynthiibacter namhaensis]|uniref:YIP1 family protein n=1 Tax=Halocynthiibacter namhaensis TaxID=1290553 RepID=UPI00068A76DD|nr:YIP1 family protein [Halocynthiibacter namhaensis]